MKSSLLNPVRLATATALAFSHLSPASTAIASAPLPPQLAATQTVALVNDVDGDGLADPGDTLRYTLAISNTGGTARGVTFSETVDPNTTPTGFVDASPLAQTATFTATNAAPLAVPAGAGLLANAFGIPAPVAITTTLAATQQGGTVSIDADGAFTYTAPIGFTGADSFTYTLTNPLGSDAGTAQVIVWALPLAQTDGYTATLNTQLNVPAGTGVLANDTVAAGAITAFAATSAQGGSVALNADGSFAYTPAAGFFSPPTDTFTYTLSNPVGTSTGTVSITVALPGPPLASADVYTATANTPLNIPAAGVLANDTVNAAVIDAYAATTAQGGSLALAPTGAFTYTPPTDFISPPTDAFTYTLRNALGSSTATVTLTVVPAGAPLAVADSYTATANVTRTVSAGAGLFANDTLQLATLTDYAATTTLGGSVSVAADGGFVYAPPTDTISPPADTFTYTIANPLGASTGTVTLTLLPPAAPLVADDVFTATADTGLVVAAGTGVLANDTLNFGTIGAYAAATSAGGSVDLAPTGAFTYTPPAGVVSPPADTFTYTVSNPLGDRTATVTITILPPGAPLTVDDAYTATANIDLVATAGTGLFANDTLRYGTLAGYGATTARGGSVVLLPTGAFTYTPPVDTVSPPTDSFTYTVTNTLGTSTATVTLTIAPPGAPSATNDVYTATANTQLGVTAGAGLLVNDTVNFATLGAPITATARGGSVIVAPTGAFTYTPPTDTVSPPTDSFTYTLTNLLGTSTGTVTLTIDPPAPPSAVGEAYTTTVNVPYSVAAPGVLANDTLNFGAITDHASASANGGSVTLAASGALTFTSAFDTLGTDTYTYTLSNALGASTATVTFTVLPPPPSVTADAYTTTGNVDLTVAAGSGVLVNDTLNWGALNGSATTSANGGTVTVSADGGFTYAPATGFTGTDTFTYTVGNAAATVTGTVTMTVSERVWFVDNTATAGGDGRHSAPFDTLAEAQAASLAGDYIYVYFGDGTSTGQNTGISLKSGQHLLGQHVALVVNSTTIEAAVPGHLPAISATISNTVTAPTGTAVEVRGLALSGGAAGDVVSLTTSGSASAGLTLSDSTLTASGNSAIDIAQASSGALTLSLSSLTISGGAPALRVNRTNGTATLTTFSNLTIDGQAVDGVQLTGVVFDATPGGSYQTVNVGTLAVGTSGNGVNGAGVTLTNVSGDLAALWLAIYADGGAGLSASGTTAYTGSAGFRLTANNGLGVITAAGGPAVAAAQATLDLQLATVSSSGSSTTGVALTTVAGTFSAGAGSTIATAAGTDFFVDGSTGVITYTGTIVNTAGHSVVVQNRSGGTVAFGGAVSDTGTGVQLLNNTGATLTFSGGLTANTGANPAFQATGGGTVSVTGSTNTLQTTTGTALTVVNTTIGTGGLNFRSISSNGATNGIVLNNTGGTAGLTVTGTGSANTGGTIQNSTGTGVSLTGTRDVSLAYMTISASGDDGIYGSSVTNFTLSQSTVTGNGNGVADEGLELDNVSGTATLNTVTVTGSAHNNVYIDNSTGTLSTLTVTNGAYQNTGATFGAHGILLTARSTATVSAISITGATFASNYGSGVFVDAADTAVIGDALIQNNTFTGNGSALTLSQSGGATQSFRVLNNTLTGSATHAVNVFSSGTSTGGALNGRLVGNAIGQNGVANSGSATGDGIRARIQAQTNGVLLFDGNTIYQTPNGRGIDVLGGSDSLDVTVINNTVMPQAASTPLAAIYIGSANLNGTQNGVVRSDVRGNTVPATVDSLDGGEYLVLGEDTITTLQLVNTTSAGTATAQLVNANTGSAAAYAAAGSIDLIAGPIGLPPLTAAEGQGPGAPVVTAEALEGVRAAAIAFWSAAGADVSALAATRLIVTELPAGRLAEADVAANVVAVDADAAGWGWFVDPTPSDAVEFAPGGAAEGRLDALTALAHELGHLLGRSHTESGLMAEALARGQRTLPPPLERLLAGSVLVDIDTLAGGHAVTIRFDVLVDDPVTGGATAVSAQGTLSGDNFAAILSDDPTTLAADDATVIALDVGRFVYLPTLLRDFAVRPDLAVSVSLSPNVSVFTTSDPVVITVVVTNTGTAPAGDFWVDAYLNPSSAPTAANQLWNERCGLLPCYGVAWHVTQPLAPGASVTLTSTPASYVGDNTIWPGHFAAGTTDLYVYVDSYSDDGGAGGQVLELSEANNRAELHALSVTGSAAAAEISTTTELPSR